MLYTFDFGGELMQARMRLLLLAGIAFKAGPGGVEIDTPLSSGQLALLAWVQTPTRPLDLAALSQSLAKAALEVHTAFWEKRLG